MAWTCMPPLCANAVWPTHGWRGSWRTLAISSTNSESSFSLGSDFAGTPRFFILKCNDRDDAGEIAIAGAFAVAVDRALHVRGAGFEPGERIGHAEADVVVRVDADARGQLASGERR